MQLHPENLSDVDQMCWIIPGSLIQDRYNPLDPLQDSFIQHAVEKDHGTSQPPNPVSNKEELVSHDNLIT